MKKILNKKTKKRVPKPKDTFIEIDNSELTTIVEALKREEKRLREENFHYHREPIGLYEMRVERIYRLIEKLNIPLPRAVFMKIPKFGI